MLHSMLDAYYPTIHDSVSIPQVVSSSNNFNDDDDDDDDDDDEIKVME